ncbi:MAG: D-inositol-3-phosphate glycosyltransferase [Candidatus Methanofastidiosum methylothiophilum]|uniref:D-inositol-3-phosphate glycosyltransferase n=1 Tax=Candidatus Methanofastidiosum methylothiophilum TaxID=1705564 RepID=A0A150ISZ4_9EURY|nr:MAG: D-inositol-3-phosphate glycosyltransferase [Candidatus Methanofastidiosum methylthiophilus]
MNILFIGEYPPKIGGISTHIYYLKKELKNLGQNVFVLTYSPSSEENVYSTRLPNKFRGFFFIIFGIIKGIIIIRKNRIDIIHSHFATTPGLVGVFLSILTRKKRIITVHGSDVNVFLNKRFMGKIVKFVLHNHSVIIAVSPYLADKLQEILKKNIISIPNGVDKFRFYPDNSQKKGIGFIGALVNEKNPQAFINIIRKIRAKGIDEPAFVIGNGYLKDELEQISSGLNINFLGEILDTENYLKKFKVVISTSTTEGFGLSILDSMACGTPVVSLKSPGSNYLLGDLNLSLDNEESITDLVEKIIKDSSLRSDLSKKVFEKSKLFSWDKCAIGVLNIYKDYLNKGM